MIKKQVSDPMLGRGVTGREPRGHCLVQQHLCHSFSIGWWVGVLFWGLGGVAKQDLVRGREEEGADEVEVGVVLPSDASCPI